MDEMHATRPMPPDWDMVTAPGLPEAVLLLGEQSFDAVVTGGNSSLLLPAVLEALGGGVALIRLDRRIVWANATFEKWLGGPPLGRDFAEILGDPQIKDALAAAFQGHAFQTRLQHDSRLLSLRLTPIKTPQGRCDFVLALGQDETASQAQQQILDRLHQASGELAGFNTDKMAEMAEEERVDFLKDKIRQFTHDLLHYDVIEIRLLNLNGELTSLLAEGMTPEAEERQLYANESGNGVTGYVAATGKTYVCTDAAHDPHYIEGAKGARSSLTIPLKWDEKVIGTFNVESPETSAFSSQEVQFAEIFCRELSTALHTFELLQFEKQTVAAQQIEAINREVALPVDEILTVATSILERWIGHEPEMAEKLKKILTGARAIKQSIQRVSENMIPALALPMSKPVETHPKLKGLRVLVVDNEDRVRRTAHAILGKLGCIVETARDGAEALTLARLSSYHAMLADIRLPDVGGFEMYRQLRQAQPQAHVILMTGFGYDGTHALVKSRQAGLKHILYKPFKVDMLIFALENPDTEPLKPLPT